MPIEMPRGLPFSVDTWSPTSSSKRHHFLTHAHKDHYAGISAHGSYPIYSSRITKTIITRHVPQVKDLFVEIEVGETVVVHDPDGNFRVTALDANHCPGAIMFLFEGEYGNILHTGDCRLGNDCLQNLPPRYVSKKGHGTNSSIDYLFLDCTFGKCSLEIPCRRSAIQQVINCIWKHPCAPTVYLACDLLGQEEVLVEVSRTFGSKIYVDRNSSTDFFLSLLLTAPEIISEDPSSRFQVIQGYPRLYERASRMLTQARGSGQPQPLFIRPSAQWYACDESLGRPKMENPDLSSPVIDDYGVWHVCYSMHSSRDELESSLRLLQPKWVISTTPPCHAMELEYVKKHCFKTKISSDDPLWKLFNISTEKSDSSSDVSKSVTGTVKTAPQFSPRASAINGRPEDNELPVNTSKQMDLCSREKSITLFGRARLNLQDWDIFHENKVSSCVLVSDAEESTSWDDNIISHRVQTPATTIGKDPSQLSSQHVVHLHGNKSIDLTHSSLEDPATIAWGDPEGGNEVGSALCFPDHKIELLQGEKFPNVASEPGRNLLRFESSKHLSDSLRKLYRSRNVPVPLSLPPSSQNVVHLHGNKSINLTRSSPEDPASTLAWVDPQGDNEVESALCLPDRKIELLQGEKSPNVASERGRNLLRFGSSKHLSDSLRKLYRSRNVPVPQSLPPLCQLINDAKRARIRS